MLSPYMSPVERVWYYSLRILCGLILLFLILPVLVIIPLSFNSGSFLVYPLQGFSLHWFGKAWARVRNRVSYPSLSPAMPQPEECAMGTIPSTLRNARNQSVFSAASAMNRATEPEQLTEVSTPR